MPAARDCHQFHTVACVVGDPVPPTPRDDVYNRDALAGRIQVKSVTYHIGDS